MMMNINPDYANEYMLASGDAARELLRLLTHKDTRKARIPVAKEFRLVLWGEDQPFMMSMNDSFAEAAALLEKKNQPFARREVIQLAMARRRKLRFVGAA